MRQSVKNTEAILGGFRRLFFEDARAFLHACEAEAPAGYTKCGSGGWVGSRDLFIDYLASDGAFKNADNPD